MFLETEMTPWRGVVSRVPHIWQPWPNHKACCLVTVQLPGPCIILWSQHDALVHYMAVGSALERITCSFYIDNSSIIPVSKNWTDFPTFNPNLMTEHWHISLQGHFISRKTTEQSHAMSHSSAEFQGHHPLRRSQSRHGRKQSVQREPQAAL